MNDESLPHLVVTGSSAGGIDALRAFVSGLTLDFPAAVIVAQHMAPTQDSRLAEILSAACPLPVVTVVEELQLERGHIYVVAPNHDVEVFDGHAMVRPAATQGAKPSIDRLFRTAAEHLGDRVIGIVFSGMGRDGLAGAHDIKERGGAVIIQNPASADYPSMPLAIPPTIVDVVAEPRQMGEIVVRLVSGGIAVAGGADAGSEQHLRDLLLQLRERSGIDFLQYKLPTIRRRLNRLMVAANAPTLEQYVRHLDAHPEAYQRLVAAFLINVTGFFRDAAFFDALRERVLPALIAAAAEHKRELRIWSAGCSTGEEAYSIAIVCAELMRESGVHTEVRIFATDLDEDAINFARQGRYGRDALRHVPPELVDRYFVRLGDTYEIKNLRHITVFGHHDLAQRAPFPRIDLVLCRNVLIYFVRELQLRALQLFAFSLRTGGVLALGKSESTSALEDYFKPIDATLKLFERVGNRALIPPLQIKTMATTSLDKLAPAHGAAWPMQGDREPRGAARASLAETVAALLFSSTIGLAVVDRRYDIVAINDAAREYLEVHGVGVGNDLLHAARTIDLVRLRELIDAAFRAERTDAQELQAGEADGVPRWLSVSVHADPSLRGSIDGVAITFVDISAAVARRDELERSEREQHELAATLRAQIADLTRRQRALAAGNEELTVANAHLRLLNEQLAISSEEAASASEEIETLYEEMQATNEELETVNEELQSTVEELNATNDELEVRTASLERASAQNVASISELEATRRALLDALRIGGTCAALLDHHGAPIFLAEQLGPADEIARLGDWWRHDGALEIDGRTMPYTVRRVGPDGQLTLVLFA